MTDALFIARRLQDISERSEENVILVLYRVSHPRMMQALERLKFPIKFRNIIARFYSNLSFQVKHEHPVECEDAKFRHKTGMPTISLLVCTHHDCFR